MNLCNNIYDYQAWSRTCRKTLRMAQMQRQGCLDYGQPKFEGAGYPCQLPDKEESIGSEDLKRRPFGS